MATRFSNRLEQGDSQASQIQRLFVFQKKSCLYRDGSGSDYFISALLIYLALRSYDPMTEKSLAVKEIQGYDNRGI